MFDKVSFTHHCTSNQSHSKNLTSLFPLIFLSKHISLYALGRFKWILDVIWPLKQHFNLKNQRNWIKQALISKFLNGMNCILLHWPKKLTSEFGTALCGLYITGGGDSAVDLHVICGHVLNTPVNVSRMSPKLVQT